MSDIIDSVIECRYDCQRALDDVSSRTADVIQKQLYETRDEIVRLKRKAGELAIELTTQRCKDDTAKRRRRAAHHALYCQLEDLLEPSEIDLDATWTCVPVGCGLAIEPFIARAAAYSVRRGGHATNGAEQGESRIDDDDCGPDQESGDEEDDIDDDERQHVTQSLRLAVCNGAEIVRAVIVVKMKTSTIDGDTEEVDTNSLFFPNDIDDLPEFSMRKWSLQSDSGEPLISSRIIYNADEPLEERASDECMHSLDTFRGDKDLFWFEQRVEVPAWAVRMPKWPRSDTSSDDI
jgi:hypothetical protein